MRTQPTSSPMFAHMTTSPNPACVCVQGLDEQRPIPTVAHSLHALGALSSEQEFEELRQCALLPVRTRSLVLVLHDPSQGGVHFPSHESPGLHICSDWADD
jgi:hypothetical protein